MRRSRLSIVGALAVALAIGVGAPAAAAGTDIAITSVEATAEAVTITVTAPAELAGRVLGATELTVTEDGVPAPAQVERISTEGLEVVVVIDSSGSMAGEPMAAARAAAAAFVRGLPTGLPVAVVGFGAAPLVAQPSTADVAAQVAAIEAITPAGETALYDAVVAATELPSAAGASRRAIVVLSDGGDTVSSATLEDAIAALQRSGTSASVVELASPESDRAALDRIAAAGNGRVLAAGDPAALAAAFDGVRSDLTGSYRLVLQPLGDGQTTYAVRLRAGTIDVAATQVVDVPAPAPTRARPTPVTKPEPSAVESTPAASTGFFGAPAMAAGIALIAVALLVAGVVIALPGRGRVRLERGAARRHKSDATAVAGLANRATIVAERAIAASERRRTIEGLLEQGGITLRAAEVIVITVSISFGLAAVGGMLAGPILGLVLAIIPPIALQPVLRIFVGRRREAFAVQLDGLLQMIAGGLRAGYGLLQAIEAASEELEDPAGAELARFTTEVRLGRDVIDALDALAVRVDNDDFAWVARAIRIHREVGGDLSEVLDRVSETIRDRARVQRQVKALSAEGRLSARVLLALPFVLALAMTVLNPSFIGPLFTTALGFVFLGIAAGLMTVGSLWLKRLVRPVF